MPVCVSAQPDVRPYYVVFAGVNGAGKSTFYHSGLWRAPSMPQRMTRINPDEIVLEQGGSWEFSSDQNKAGREALKRISECFSQGLSFNQETTLAGRTSVARIKKAHNLGYRVVLFYIGIQNAKVALERIAHRVQVGGHDISEEAVKRRFDTSIANFFKVLPYCECAAVFDNTQEFKCVAEWSHGLISWWGNPKLYAPWLLEHFASE